jgi:Ca2+-binding EF-hand superfamily protein
MKVSNSMIAAAVVALLPLAAAAGDKDKTPGAMATETSAQFDTLDTDRDGRISRAEAASDTKIMFATADKNGDGYLDSTEYLHRDMSKDPTTNSADPAKEVEKSRE